MKSRVRIRHLFSFWWWARRWEHWMGRWTIWRTRGTPFYLVVDEEMPELRLENAVVEAQATVDAGIDELALRKQALYEYGRLEMAERWGNVCVFFRGGPWDGRGEYSVEEHKTPISGWVPQYELTRDGKDWYYRYVGRRTHDTGG